MGSCFGSLSLRFKSNKPYFRQHFLFASRMVHISISFRYVLSRMGRVSVVCHSGWSQKNHILVALHKGFLSQMGYTCIPKGRIIVFTLSSVSLSASVAAFLLSSLAEIFSQWSTSSSLWLQIESFVKKSCRTLSSDNVFFQLCGSPTPFLSVGFTEFRHVHLSTSS